MFAKVFGQIFDSSIAEDYNCRRMFMDLLVLADSDGVVDMTAEAIARRTNVPLEQVSKYVAELQQPDESSRSKMEEGRRLVPIDEGRGWGWRIVNYRHYRQIRDEEARRSYFRDVKRKQRKREKANVLDSRVDSGGHCQTVASASSSDFIEVLKGLPAYKGIDVAREIHKMEAWLLTPKGKGRKLTKGFAVNWLNKVDVPLSPTAGPRIPLRPAEDIPAEFPVWLLEHHPDRRDDLSGWVDWNKVPFLLRDGFFKWKKTK